MYVFLDVVQQTNQALPCKEAYQKTFLLPHMKVDDETITAYNNTRSSYQ